jgi:hypothetical protein
MSFSIQKFPNEPIVLVVFNNDFDPLQDYPLLWEALGRELEGMPGPIYRITNMLDINLTLSALMIGMAQETRGGSPGSASDPRMRGSMVAAGILAELIAKSFQQEQYGGRAAPVPLFSTVDEALAHARAELTPKPA